MSFSSARIVSVLCLTGLLAACGSSSHVRTDARPVTTRAPVAAPPRPAISGATYRVAKGDTLYGIAFRNGLDFRDLAQWNNIAPPYTIFLGQTLRLGPAGSVVAKNPSTPTAPPKPATNVAPAKPIPTGPAAAASAGAVTSAPPATAQHPSIGNTGPVSFRWPLEGPLLQRYAAGDPTRSGVDIGSKAGTQVRAAADGEVVYSGNGLVLYGELIIIKHTNALLSAYARNGKRLVEEGSRVKAGQPIAEIGSSRPSLHFEIRRDGKPVNPLDYLPPR